MKKIFTLCFAIIASIGTMFAESGTCGENVRWDLTDGVLTISGTGAMTDYNIPWNSYLSSIKSVVINDGVTSICGNAFDGCSSMIAVTIPNSVTSIGDWAFRYCSGLTSVTIPNSVTSIGRSAFYECTSLTTVNIPNSITSIGDGAFEGCTSLPIINNIRYVDTYLVEAANKTLTTYTILDGTKWIGARAFSECTELTSIIIPNSVISIQGAAFYKCKSLASIVIPNSITEIEYKTFLFCESLKSVVIPNSVTQIWYGAFDRCTSLESIEIPNSVTHIWYGAFAGCTSLKSITIPNSVIEFGYNPNDKDGAGVFSECTSLTSIDVSMSNPNYCSIDGVVFNKYKTILIQYPGGKQGTCTIPNSVTSIGYMAFYGCIGLTSITCEAVNPPSCDDFAFYEISRSIPLYVPANSVSKYKKADIWKEWGDNIKPIQASETEVIDPSVTPTGNSVIIDWPKADGAVVYTITIKKGDELICTLEFNELGQLLNIAFSAPARDGKGRQAPAALQTATGWQYAISGLEPDTDYSYTVVAKRSDDSEVYNKTIPFKTKDTATEVDQVQSDQVPSTKVIENGVLYIKYKGTKYNVLGQLVN